MIENQDDGDIVELLYELVSSPGEYDAFMQSLDDKLDSLAANTDKAPNQAEALVSHLGRASELLDVVTPWKQVSRPSVQQTLTPKIQAMMAVDETGRIIEANDTANVAYGLSQGATYLDLFADSTEQDSFLNAVRDIISGRVQRNSIDYVRRFHAKPNDTPILLTLKPFRIDASGKIVAIVKTSDIGWPSYLGPILEDLFDLTPAEIEVVKLLLEGEKVSEIANRRMNSVATVRSQLRSIYTKTETSGQLDCLRMIFGLSLMHGEDEGELVAAQIQKTQSTPFFPQDHQRAILDLADGRKMEYAVFGSPSGTPVLFYHCEVAGETWFREAVETATKLRLKIVTPMRPGYGQSSLHESQSNDPHRFARDVEQLMDHLQIIRAPICAVSCGFIPGLATAALMPDRIIGITTTRPYFPASSEAELEGFTGYTQLVQRIRLRFPQALRFVVKAGFAFVSASGPLAFGKSLVRGSPQDVAWISRSDIAPMLIRSLETFRCHGYQGTFSDLNYFGEWREMLESSKLPIRILIGEHDNNVQWTTAREWAGKKSNIALETMPNSGYMVHHQHSGKILNWIAQDISTNRSLIAGD